MLEVLEDLCEPPVTVADESESSLFLSSGMIRLAAQTSSVALEGADLVVSATLLNTTGRAVNSVTVSLVKDVRVRMGGAVERTKKQAGKVASLTFPAPASTFDLVFPVPPGLQVTSSSENLAVSYRLVVTPDVTMATCSPVFLPVRIAKIAQLELSSAPGLDSGSVRGLQGQSLASASRAGRDMSEEQRNVAPKGVLRLEDGCPQEHTVFFQQYIMFYVDIFSLAPPGSVNRLVVDVDGIGRSSVIMLASKGYQPGIITGSDAQAQDLQHYKYTLVMEGANLTAGRWFIGVWGNQVFPKPKSEFRITLRLTGASDKPRGAGQPPPQPAAISANALLAATSTKKAIFVPTESHAAIATRIDSNLATKPLLSWTVADVAVWFRHLGMPTAADRFASVGVSGPMLATLDPEDYAGLGITDPAEVKALSQALAGLQVAGQATSHEEILAQEPVAGMEAMKEEVEDGVAEEEEEEDWGSEGAWEPTPSRQTLDEKQDEDQEGELISAQGKDVQSSAGVNEGEAIAGGDDDKVRDGDGEDRMADEDRGEGEGERREDEKLNAEKED